MNYDGLKEYVAALLQKELRSDERKLTEYRKIKIEVNISKNAEGSAKVTMGDTEVIAGVKLDVGEPFPDSADDGILMVGAELLPLSSPEFESGPPGAKAIEVARIVDRGIRESGMIDIKKLCIRKGELVWLVFLDIYTINDDGNLIDAAALAAVVALQHTFFPKLEKDKVVFGEKTKTKVPLTKIPLTVTLVKIGNKILIDPTEKEEKVADSRLTITISEDKQIHAIQKGGNKSISVEDFSTMVDIAMSKAEELKEVIKHEIHEV